MANDESIFNSSRLKIARSREHLAGLGDEFERYLDRCPYRLIGEYDQASERFLFRCKVVHGVPERFGLLIGDAVQNARAALDHLACQLIRLRQGSASPSWDFEPRRVQFPIVHSEDAFRQQLGPLSSLEATEQEFLATLQPFNLANAPALIRGLSHPDPLTVLATLSNVDKHRVVHTTVSVLDAATYGIVDRDVESVDSPITFTFKGFEEGRVIAWAGVRPKGPNPRLHIVGDFSLRVAFDFQSPSDPLLADHASTLETLHERDVFEVVGSVIDHVETIVTAFERSARDGEGAPAWPEPREAERALRDLDRERWTTGASDGAAEVAVGIQELSSPNA